MAAAAALIETMLGASLGCPGISLGETQSDTLHENAPTRREADERWLRRKRPGNARTRAGGSR